MMQTYMILYGVKFDMVRFIMDIYHRHEPPFVVAKPSVY